MAEPPAEKGSGMGPIDASTLPKSASIGWCSSYTGEICCANYRDSIRQERPASWFISASWKSGYVKSFNGQLWDESLNGEIFQPLLETKIPIQR